MPTRYAAILLGLAACSGEGGGGGGGGGGGANCENVQETGLAQLYFVGDFAANPTTLQSAHFGYGMKAALTGEWACVLTGELQYAGDPPAGCPDCTWAFDLSPVMQSAASGDYCQAFNFTDGSLDGGLDYAWGYTPMIYYDYSGTPLKLDQALMVYTDSEQGWFPFAFNYGDRHWVTGDSTNLVVERPGFTEGVGYAYYYYYTGNTTEKCD